MRIKYPDNPKYPFIFWYDSWTSRGIGIPNGRGIRNIHFIDLVCMRGYTFEYKWMNCKSAWKGLLTLGRR